MNPESQQGSRARDTADLPPPDIHFLNAAQGWLELGNPAEAGAELERVSEASKHHPDVLQCQWEALAGQKSWEEALSTARLLIIHSGEQPVGWIHQSYCLHELKRTQDAWDCLRPLAERFPAVSTIPYNLACYGCQMGRLEEARKWLERAMKIGGREAIVDMASRDPDLEPLWPELRAAPS